MSQKSKKEMLQTMKENGWHCIHDESSKWQDIKDEYDTFIDEMSSDIDMFPNGRDYDAEDEDGPF